MSEQYDVVIVGAGICGSIVAKALAEKGKRVLILEAGNDKGLTPEGYRGFVDNFYTNPIKVPNSPYPYNKNAPQNNDGKLERIPPPPKPGKTTKGYPDTNDPYLVQYGPLPFSSGYTRNTGGTTLHWLGTCLRMLPNDFNLKKLYNQGVDWPIKYKHLKPYYEMAEHEIGVSADVKDQMYPGVKEWEEKEKEEYFGSNYEYPMQKVPQSYLDQYLTRAIRGMKVPFGEEDVELFVESTPQGRNSMPNPRYRDPKTRKAFQPVGAVGDPDIGQRCEGNSACVPICPVQAKYNAMKTLDSAMRQKGPVELRARAVASKITIHPDSGRVSGIVYKRYEDENKSEYREHTAKGKIYVIAAHAIETAKLLLASNIANSSGQLGCNLMDHPSLVTWGLLPENIGSYRGPGSTSGIPSFRDGSFRSKHAAFRIEIGNWGWTWPAFSPGSDVGQAVDSLNLFGRGLRQRLADVLPRQFRIAWEPEQTPEKSNRIEIDRDGKFNDALGNPRPLLHYDLPQYTKRAIAAAKDVSAQLFQRLGVEDHTQYGDPNQPGYFLYDRYEDDPRKKPKGYKPEAFVFRGAGHVVGTHRMGLSRGDSVVNSDQQTWDHDNLYLVGCGNMPTLATSNPTLTIAALSFKAADAILKRLGR